MSDSNGTSGGIGFGGLLQVLLIGLKLTDNIDWSWGWVMAPSIFWVIILAIMMAIIIILD